MMRKTLPIVYVVGLAAILVVAALNRNNQNMVVDGVIRTGPMTLPMDYQETFIHYATIDRSDEVVRFLYIDPVSYENVERGAPMPEGTQLIIEAYDALRDENGEVIYDELGRFIAGEMIANVHMAEKRSTWRIEDLATTTGAIDWNFRSFDAETYENTLENRNDCFACHDTVSRRDMVFTRFRIDEVQMMGDRVFYLYCDRPNRDTRCH